MCCMRSRFVDQAPASIYATLLDEGRYLCAAPTMCRVLRAEDEVHGRRRQARHSATVKPEPVATRPNTVWSWDITQAPGPREMDLIPPVCDHRHLQPLYPGCLLAKRETAELAEHLIAETIRKHNLVADRLTIHADRGTSMASKTVALLLADLGVNKSHSRPHCSNNNPYSEAQFKTLKYRPEFTDRSARLKMAALSADISSGGTTTSTAIQALGSTPRRQSISVAPKASRSCGRVSCKPPTLLIPKACSPSAGSTATATARPSLDQSVLRRSREHSNSPADRSHQG